MLILTILVLGLAAGWFANILVGDDRTSGGQMLLVGLVGSLVGGILASLVAGDGFEIHLSGLLGSIIGATLLLVIMRALHSEGAPRAR